MKVPRVWPGFLAVWAAVLLHLTWVVLLLWPDSSAGRSTPVNQVVLLAGSNWRAAVLFLVVSLIALYGTIVPHVALSKIICILPQQLVLGISAAGAIIAMLHSHYADGVERPGTFIIADQTAIVLTWGFHTVAILVLFLIHQRVLALSGHLAPANDA